MYTIGIDEVGRGPIAGPVVVCVCAMTHGIDILPFFPKEKLRDSKKLSGKVRLSIVEKIAPHIESSHIVLGIGEVSAERIDEIGISKAIKEATQIALSKVHANGVPEDSFIFLDGSLSVDPMYQQETIIKGDEKIPEIAIPRYTKISRAFVFVSD
jgi:ribonuclease HII